MRWIYGVFALVMMGTAWSAQGQSFCFALAETYYEQVYCQLQARAQTKGLPSFHEFRKNNQTIQAALLRRPAERNGIKLPAVAKPVVASTDTETTSFSVKSEIATGRRSKTSARTEPADDYLRNTSLIADTSGCLYRTHYIECNGIGYQLTGNKTNTRLRSGVLDTENKMALPEQVDLPLQPYLEQAYGQYIHKMCEIGLCGVTMTYGKFAYLYQDVQAKGLNFSQRFETMFSFLKEDKASMGVSEALPDTAGLRIEQCALLRDRYFVCEMAGRNLVYVRQ